MLIEAADAAYPPDLSKLQPEVRAVLGYVGGQTANVWTMGEAASVRLHGFEWWPIWTAPNSNQPPHPALSAAQGAADARGMLAALPPYGVTLMEPKFYDIEYSTWTASPQGALDALGAFKSVMHAAGHPNVFGYLPLAAGFDWVAHWTNIKPSALLSNVVGIQYGGDIEGEYDLSVFDTVKLGIDPTPLPPIEPEDLDMYLIIRQSTGAAYLLCGTTAAYGLHSASDVTALTNADIPIADVSAELQSRMLQGRTVIR